jgi:Centromere DNA-binding protein complex CBF3 subunit, domain 2
MDILPENQRPPSISLLFFIKLLKYLRVVLLQDAAILKNEYPGDLIWTHPLFSSAEFRSFQAEVVFAEQNVADPLSQQIENIVPDIALAIQNSSIQLTSLENKMRTEFLNMFNEFNSRFNALDVKIDGQNLTAVQAFQNFTSDLNRSAGRMLSKNLI